MILLIMLVLFGQVHHEAVLNPGQSITYESRTPLSEFVIDPDTRPAEDSPSIYFHTLEYTCSTEDGITIYKTSDAWTARELIGMYEYSKNIVVAYCSTYTGGSGKDKGISFISTLILTLIPAILLVVGYLAGYNRGRKQ